MVFDFHVLSITPGLDCVVLSRSTGSREGSAMAGPHVARRNATINECRECGESHTGVTTFISPGQEETYRCPDRGIERPPVNQELFVETTVTEGTSTDDVSETVVGIS